MGPIEQRALDILKDFRPQINNQPASLSGINHAGETCSEHVERCASMMRHLCDGMNIHGSDRDMLIACAYLHDLGIYAISRPGNMTPFNEPGDAKWIYYPKCNTSRKDILMGQHPLISAEVLEKCYEIPRKEEIKKIISTHMGHWYRYTPRPENLFEYLIVLADFLSTRSESLTDYQGEYKK